ncbi:MAG: type II toxin-antitoxin system Phd/YefM family antitoxin [Candidatus Omnitrophica bacterium]|nr:type II toxin-antitoxin system Phd/YefM family antitoxin [Candidatus Omnitrophota bacterium]
MMKPLAMVPVTEFRAHALEAVRRVNRWGDEVIITAKGRPAAVLVSYDEWESLAETVAIKRDPRLMAQIRASLRYLRRGGRGIPLERVDWGHR